MDKETIEILKQVQAGKLSAEEAAQKLSQMEELDFATLDYSRQKRTGFPEVIYAEGKTPEQVLSIFTKLRKRHDRVLATRVKKEQAEQVLSHFPDTEYHETARTLFWHKKEADNPVPGYVAVVCAGTSDLPVAEEAAVTAEAMGVSVRKIYDVGVAGIHRLFARLDIIREADAIIVVAGMEGALASVIGGLVSKPVIAVPTSVGYGSHLNGIAPLLTMLNSCASGVTVVNIDNGYGAGHFAALILQNKYDHR
ncbi:MAG: nickel pincer cofactor biosynthesis protein LarB [Bacillaceae bacterium]|nr:nickel pincer cofactor biosynthesis protein LarB [Bacillaceae bacterium]